VQWDPPGSTTGLGRFRGYERRSTRWCETPRMILVCTYPLDPMRRHGPWLDVASHQPGRAGTDVTNWTCGACRTPAHQSRPPTPERQLKERVQERTAQLARANRLLRKKADENARLAASWPRTMPICGRGHAGAGLREVVGYSQAMRRVLEQV